MNNLKPNNSKSVLLNYCSIIIAIIAVNQTLILTPKLPQTAYYAVMSIFLLFGLFKSKSLNFNVLTVWILIASIISILINDVPELFRSPERLLSFTIMIALIGPLFSSVGLDQIKTGIFSQINKLLILVGVFSFFTYLFRIPLPYGPAGWAGFYFHPLTLGPLAAIAVILTLYMRFTRNKIKVITQKRYLIDLAIVFSFFCVILASSRAAILGLIAAVLFFFYKLYQGLFSKFLTSVFILFMFILVSFPLWSDFSEGITQKNKIALKKGDMTFSRKASWNKRLKEFNSSPLFGIGFATVKTINNKSEFKTPNGGIEPGTSWLSILSMIGIFGFIPVIILFGQYILFLLRDQQNRITSAALGGLLFFFITHMFAEGYFLASGSIMFFYIWLLLGFLEIYKRNRDLTIL